MNLRCAVGTKRSHQDVLRFLHLPLLRFCDGPEMCAPPKFQTDLSSHPSATTVGPPTLGGITLSVVSRSGINFRVAAALND